MHLVSSHGEYVVYQISKYNRLLSADTAIQTVEHRNCELMCGKKRSPGSPRSVIY
jgi:hypothetical protein